MTTKSAAKVSFFYIWTKQAGFQKSSASCTLHENGIPCIWSGKEFIIFTPV